jgi:hypothetical protein
MLEESSFIVLSSQRVSVPFGNFCDSVKSRNGAPLSKYKALTLSNYLQISGMIMLAGMRGGGVLDLVDGTHIATEGGRLALMDELGRSLIEGGFMIASDWVAVRTRESCGGTRLCRL